MPSQMPGNDSVRCLRSDIEQLPSILAQMAFVAQFRDPNTGMYSHPAASRSRDQEVHHTFTLLHERAFRRWLNLGLDAQKADLNLYFSSLTCNRATVVETWRNLESYRSYIPAAASRPERSLFVTDMNVLLQLMGGRSSSVPNSADDTAVSRVMLNVKEVSRWLQIAPRTLRLWAETGELPAFKAGRPWRFFREDVAQWVRRRLEANEASAHRHSRQ